MELKEFISQSLVQIIEGVKDAQSKVNSQTAKINPEMQRILNESSGGYAAFGWAKGGGPNPVFLVDFDVAVTAEEGKNTKGGVGVVAGVFALGTQGQSQKANSAISRIQFKVPLLLPIHGSKPTA